MLSPAGRGEPEGRPSESSQLVASHAGGQHVGIQRVANAVKIWLVSV